MKPIFLALLLMGMGVCCLKAQSVKFIAEAGLNVSTLGPSRTIYDNPLMPSSINFSTATGFYVGGTAEFSEGKFSINPGLHFSQLTSKSTVNETDISSVGIIKFNYTSTDRINYLELPVNVLYHVNRLFFVGLGPYAAFGLSGRTDLNGTYSSSGLGGGNAPYVYSQNDTFDNAHDRQFIYGANALVGVMLPEKFRVSAGYDINLSGPYYGSPKIYNHTIKVSVGYAL